MRLISGEALRGVYADSEIAIPFLPLFVRAPVPVRPLPIEASFD